MGAVKVAIHQPNYWPWLGYLSKMREADIFVYLDNVAYEKNGFQNRNRFMIDGKEHWLTIPVLTKGRMGQAIKDVEVNWDADWAKRHYHMILYNYINMIKLPEDGLGDFFLSKHRYKLLINWCVESVSFLRAVYKIKTKIIFESTLNVGGIGTQRLVNICKKLNADVYLSGMSGKDYIDEKLFGGIKVEYAGWKSKLNLSALHYYLKDETIIFASI